jgi:catechol 2,3-dioxygenase-like lactoylglutathione lyase family enzyme
LSHTSPATPASIATPARTPLFRRIDTVILRVSKLEAAVRWYESVLGLLAMHHDDTARLAVLALDGTSLTLWERGAGEAAPAATATATYPIFATDDAAGAREHLAAHGVAVGALESGEGVRFFRFADPDGNVLEACEVE